MESSTAVEGSFETESLLEGVVVSEVVDVDVVASLLHSTSQLVIMKIRNKMKAWDKLNRIRVT